MKHCFYLLSDAARKLLLCFFALCLAAGLVLAPYSAEPAFAVTYYVSNSGSNITGDGSESNPWRTITFALTHGAAGNTLVLKPGIYSSGETFPLNLSTANTIITGEARGSTRVETSSNSIFSLTSTRLTLSTFTLRSSAASEMITTSSNCNGSYIFNCVLTGEAPGIVAQHNGTITLETCTIFSGTRCFASSGANNVSYLTSCLLVGITTPEAEGIRVGGRARLYMSYSTIANAKFGILDEGATFISVSHSVIYHSQDTVYGAIGSVNNTTTLTRTIEVTNCAFADNRGAAIMTANTAGSGYNPTVTVKNSVIAYNNFGLQKNADTNTFASSYNDVYGNVAGNYDGVSTGEGDISVVPYFVSTAEGNYRLQSQADGYTYHSPCIDRGDPADDYSQEPNPNGSRINQGRYGGITLAELSRAGAQTYYVNANTGSNANSGGATDPWKTITYALTQVATGDTVNVAAGLYDRVSNGETFPWDMGNTSKWLSLKGEGASTTIEASTADGSQLNYIFRIARSGTTTIDGFSIVAADGAEIISLLDLNGGRGNAVISQNYFNGKDPSLVAQGIDCAGAGGVSGAIYSITNNVIANVGFGISLGTSGEASIINNTIFGCDNGSGGGGILVGSYNTLQIRNNIVTNCWEGIGMGGGVGNTVTWGYNAGYQNTRFNFDPRITTSETNVELNPYFVSTAEGNFRLQSQTEGYAYHSPCIDRGDPSDDYSLEPEPNGSRINLGRYGGTTQAELSRTGAQTYYVNANTGSNANSGGAADPWKTITYALTQVATGDTVNVAVGLYDRANNGESFPLEMGGPIFLRGAGFSSTTIEGSTADGSELDKIIITAPTGRTTIEGFYIAPAGTNAVRSLVEVAGSGAGANQSTEFKQNFLNGVSRSQTRNGLDSGSFHTARRASDIFNNIISNCSLGVSNREEETIVLKNNTFYNDDLAASFSTSGANTSAEVKNNIFAACSGGVDAVITTGTTIICRYNVGYENGTTYGNGTTTDETDYDGVNPYFVSTVEGNFRLMSSQEGYPVHSPCIDLGDPLDDYSNEPAPNGSRINLGVYGNTAQAELSWTTPKAIYVTRPGSSGDNYMVGARDPIQWTSSGSIESVKLEYSTDDFSTVVTIEATTENDGNYTWTVPDDVSTTAKVRVSSAAEPTIEGTSPDYFSIVERGTTTFWVSANTGSDQNDGKSQAAPWKTITWAMTQVITNDTVRVKEGLYDAVGNGETFPIGIDYPVALEGDGLAVTTIEGSGSGTSEIDLVIKMAAAGGTTGINGFTVTISEGVTVGWLVAVMGNLEDVAIMLSGNHLNGRPAASCQGGFSGGETDAGLRQITVRNNLFTGGKFGMDLSSFEGTVRNNTVYDCSTGGIIFVRGNILNIRNNIVVDSNRGIGLGADALGNHITWRYNDAYANATWNFDSHIASSETNVEIDPIFVSTTESNFRLMSSQEGYPRHSPCIDGGDPADEYSHEPEPNGSRINMGYLGDTDNAELSWTPSPEATITILTPAAGETQEAGSVLAVTWVSSGEVDFVKLEYSTNNFVSAETIVASTENIDFYDWTLPEIESSTIRVRVSKATDPAICGTSEAFLTFIPTFTIVSPEAGASWEAGTTKNITWTNSVVTTLRVTIECSLDNFATTTTISADAANTGSYAWLVPSTTSSNVRVRISSDTVPRHCGTSEPFSILAARSLTLTAPNGGEKWLEEEVNNITWTSSGEITFVKIEYSTDDFASSTTVVASTENDGTYAWTVPNDPSTTVKVRISDASDTSIISTSEADFEILSSSYRIASGQILSFPTPWRPLQDGAIKMAYYLSSDQDVRMAILGVSGEIVYSNNFIGGGSGGSQGYNEITWDGRTSYGSVVGNGIYIIKLISGNRQVAKGHLVVLD